MNLINLWKFLRRRFAFLLGLVFLGITSAYAETYTLSTGDTKTDGDFGSYSQVILDGGTLEGTGTVRTGYTLYANPNTISTINTASDLKFNNILSGSGNLTVSGRNAFWLLGDMSDYSGTIGISSGTYGVYLARASSWGGTDGSCLGSAKAVFNIASGSRLAALYFSENTTFSIGALNGAGQLSTEYGKNNPTATFTLGNTLGIDGSFSGEIKDTYTAAKPAFVAIEKVGANTQTFSGTMNYTGATTVTGGTLKFSGSGFTTSGFSVAKDANLEFGYSDEQTNTKAISGEGNVIVSGTGALTLTNTNTYQGTTAITNGTLDLGIVNAIATSSAVTVNGNLTFGNYNQTLKNISGSGSITGTADMELNVTNETTKYTGTLKAGNIHKTGTGTLQIDSTGEGVTVTGNWSVDSGRMDLKGYLIGSLEVNDTSFFSPGNSIGTATVGAAEFKDSSILLIEVDGTECDILNVDSIAFGTDTRIQILDLGSGVSTGQEYEFLISQSTLPEVDWTSILINSPGWMLYSNGNGVFAAPMTTPVPEPATWVLLVLSSVSLFLIIRRKR